MTPVFRIGPCFRRGRWDADEVVVSSTPRPSVRFAAGFAAGAVALTGVIGVVGVGYSVSRQFSRKRAATSQAG